MISISSIVSTSKSQISTNLSDEIVILNTENGVYYGLNQVGAFIWKHIQEPIQVSNILSILLEHYDVDAGNCTNDLLAILNDLDRHGLIEVQG